MNISFFLNLVSLLWKFLKIAQLAQCNKNLSVMINEYLLQYEHSRTLYLKTTDLIEPTFSLFSSTKAINCEMLFTENILFDILVLLVTFVVVIITYLKWSFTYWKNKNVLQPPPSIPFGNMQSFGEKKISAPELFQKHYKQFKHKHVKYFGMNIIFKPILIPMDLDFIKTIMTKDFEYFTDHGIFINKEDDPLSAHLFSLGGSEWRNLRTKLTPTFTSGKMKMMYETVINCSEGLTKLVDDFFDKPLEISDVIGRFTTDVIGSCAFGIDCNSLKDADSEFRKYSKDVFKVSKKQAFVRIVWLLVPQISQLLKFKFTSVELSKFFMGVVSGTLDYREKNNVIRKDFMHLLIQLKNNVDIKEGDQVGQIKNTDASNSSKKVGLTFNEIAAQAFVFFVAGFETSSTLLTSCFYELAINPDVQFKLRKEINEILQKHGEKITYDALTEMTYMEKCVNGNIVLFVKSF